MRLKASIRESKDFRLSCARDGNTAALTLPDHVHVCSTVDGSVILDLKRDRYLGLGREDTALISTIVDAWPKAKWVSEDDEARSEMQVEGRAARAEALCSSLQTRGILIEAGGGRGRAQREPPRDMRREWVSMGDELDVDVQLTWRHVGNFAAAFAWSRLSLAVMPLWWTVRSMQKRKARGAVVVWDLPRVLEVAGLIDAFRLMRPFVFAAEGRCLLHALVLTRFLGRYGFFPDWIFGVATQPWAAHSWVQWGDFLLDTNPEKVCGYTPIFAV
jgi:hypothetical protein